MQVLRGLKVNVCICRDFYRQVGVVHDLGWLDISQNSLESLYLCWHIAVPELNAPTKLPNQNWLGFDQLVPRKMSAATGIYVPFI